MQNQRIEQGCNCRPGRCEQGNWAWCDRRGRKNAQQAEALPREIASTAREGVSRVRGGDEENHGSDRRAPEAKRGSVVVVQGRPALAVARITNWFDGKRLRVIAVLPACRRRSAIDTVVPIYLGELAKPDERIYDTQGFAPPKANLSAIATVQAVPSTHMAVRNVRNATAFADSRHLCPRLGFIVGRAQYAPIDIAAQFLAKNTSDVLDVGTHGSGHAFFLPARD